MLDSKKERKDTENIVIKTGKSGTQGVCPVCGTKIFSIERN
jgi:predicted RNA-binding Zn-ribbon protein involved in translation (DUF1610 family)